MKDLFTIKQIIAHTHSKDFTYFKENLFHQFAIGCMDLTILEGNNTPNDIISLCNKASHNSNLSTASVCIYPVFCKTAKNQLQNTTVKVACVAGGFPAGQIPIHLKINEVKYAIDEGADEIDMVISRGKFLEEKYTEVFDEIAAIKSICGDQILLKVILETGELLTIDNIYKASEIAINAGADFIKTSTGKISVNATPESFTTMLFAIKSHFIKTGKQVGIKLSGGIKEEVTAKSYCQLLYEVLGEKWMNKHYFRIGASRLFDTLIEQYKTL